MTSWVQWVLLSICLIVLIGCPIAVLWAWLNAYPGNRSGW